MRPADAPTPASDAAPTLSNQEATVSTTADPTREANADELQANEQHAEQQDEYQAEQERVEQQAEQEQAEQRAAEQQSEHQAEQAQAEQRAAEQQTEREAAAEAAAADATRDERHADAEPPLASLPAQPWTPPEPNHGSDPSEPAQEAAHEPYESWADVHDDLVRDGVLDDPHRVTGAGDTMADRVNLAVAAGFTSGVRPSGVDAAVWEYRHQGAVLDALGLRGTAVDGAHLVASSAIRHSPDPILDAALQTQTARDGLVVGIPHATHVVLDNPWKARAIAQRRDGDTEQTVRDLRASMGVALNALVSLDGSEDALRERNTLQWIVELELHRRLELRDDDRVNLPYPNVRPT
jgi:chemotaxis protein histidine kinase CheA